MRDLVNIAPFIENAILNPMASRIQIEDVCDASRHLNLVGVCVSSRDVSIARQKLDSKSQVKVVVMIGFPFGSVSQKIKQAEAEQAASEGADELDIVPNFSALNNGELNSFADEIGLICDLGLPVKVILEVGRLENNLLELAVEASIDAGATFLETSTGLGPRVTVQHVEHLSTLVKGRAGIKAAGGIADLDTSFKLLDAGASRLGTSKAFHLIEAFRSLHRLR